MNLSKWRPGIDAESAVIEPVPVLAEPIVMRGTGRTGNAPTLAGVRPYALPGVRHRKSLLHKASRLETAQGPNGEAGTAGLTV